MQMTKQITDYVNEILTEDELKKMRDAIAYGILLAYQDGIKSGNANMEVSQARGSYPTLDSRLDASDDILTSTTAQLAQTETDVDNLTTGKIDKNGSGQVSWANIAQDAREQITGGNTAVVGVDSVLEINITDKAVSPKKLNRLYVDGQIGKNKFNKNDVIDGKYIEPSTGNVINGSGNSASDYIEVKADTHYRFTNLFTGAFYDSNKAFIEGASNMASYNSKPTPINAAFVRVSVVNTNLNAAQIEEGTIATAYEEYKHELKDGSVTESKLSRMYAYGQEGKNKFNKSKRVEGKYVIPTSGNIGSSSDTDVTDFIPVTPNGVYSQQNFSGPFARYGANKEYISGHANVNAFHSLNIPSDVYYLRLGVKKTDVDIAQFEEGETRTAFEPYGIYPWKTSDMEGLSEIITYTDIIVKKDGTGDFTSPKLANDSISDSNYNKRYNIIVYDGTYTEINWTPKDYVNIIGVNKDTCILQGELADNATDADITAKSTVNLTKNNNLKNITVTCRNMRYPIHDDGGGTDKERNVENCLFIHYGNDGARANRTANGLDPNTVWTSENAYGSGVNSGDVVRYKNCTFISPVNAWGTHNNENYEKPTYIEHDNSNFVLNSSKSQHHNSIGIAVMGSGNKDKIVFKGCKANAPVRYFIMSTPAINAMTDKAEFQFSGYGNDLSFEVQLGGQRYVPQFNDECKNVFATEAILKGQACCYTSDMLHVRKMLPADDESLFAGIAINDITANSYGDIKFKGYMEKEDLNLASITFGQKYEVGSDSYLVAGITKPIGMCLGYNQVKFI